MESMENVHKKPVQDLMARTTGTSNTMKIVPLITFQDVIESCKQIEEGRFFFPPEAAASSE
jgi:hypothetical protein